VTHHGVVEYLSEKLGEVSLYRVMYDDGDEEDMTLLQLTAAMNRYESNMSLEL
jgi:hypothetical protein